MKLNSFPEIVKFLLKDLPNNDYPVLNSRLFCSIWFTGILDKGINSLRDLFYRLNHAGTQVDLSTFSKANKTRYPQILMHLYHKGASIYITRRLSRWNANIIDNHRWGLRPCDLFLEVPIIVMNRNSPQPKTGAVPLEPLFGSPYHPYPSPAW